MMPRTVVEASDANSYDRRSGEFGRDVGSDGGTETSGMMPRTVVETSVFLRLDNSAAKYNTNFII
jgi:hypothetical protein